uniref:Regulator of G protein signaling 13 n=1 Tax=Oncorhynchus kisutch TaxID=8019 RepID=A0A8C7N8I5_ONCKI
MPSLIITETLTQTQHFNMEQDDRGRNKNLGKNFICRLQCMFSHSTSESRLSLEDTQQWSQSLERLLESKYGLATFRTFLKSEFSDENIEFWLTCEEYKKIKSSFRMSSKAKKIYEHFIKAEAPKEVRLLCITVHGYMLEIQITLCNLIDVSIYFINTIQLLNHPQMSSDMLY